MASEFVVQIFLLMRQIYKRFEFENTVVKELEILDPKCVLKKKLPSIAHLASKFPAIVTKDSLRSLDMQNHRFDFDGNVSAEEFRFHIKKLNAGDGSPVFPHLISFVEALLCLHIPVQTRKEFFQL
ncbi:hypothetical protein PR048_023245 [Dryococelus australis]|uniref:Uncharacterized protein n=1 Tax=Dryococelus australis TaxID=614101 RepID=A0ABQ9GTJ2_9NEOP|nr:hypothetical protein PR048_023245 [Dryococelus australis]